MSALGLIVVVIKPSRDSESNFKQLAEYVVQTFISNILVHRKSAAY
jgi:hypothetical protein